MSDGKAEGGTPEVALAPAEAGPESGATGDAEQTAASGAESKLETGQDDGVDKAPDQESNNSLPPDENGDAKESAATAADVKETDTPPSESTTEPKAEDATNTAEEGKGEGTPADEGESKTGEDVAGVEDGKPGEDAAEANVDGKETGAAEAQPATDGKTTELVSDAPKETDMNNDLSKDGSGLKPNADASLTNDALPEGLEMPSVASVASVESIVPQTVVLSAAEAAEILDLDVDGDGIVTTTEIRADKLNDELETEIKRTNEGDKYAGQQKDRYSKFEAKALAKMRFSRKYWTDHQAKLKEEKKNDPTIVVKPKRDYATVWEAAEFGDVAGVKQFVERDQFDVRKHNDSDANRPGSTALHFACWYGHPDLVQYLLETAAEQFGKDCVVHYVNELDTSHYGANSLLEVSRSCHGHYQDRTRIVQLLLDAKVDVTHQDATGDNALHWAARNSHLDVVKYLCRKSESAVLAVVAENFQREKPTDVARKKFEKKETTATTEIYGILLNSLKGCNVRLKIRKGKQRRLDKQQKDMLERQYKRQQTIEKHRLLHKSATKQINQALDEAHTSWEEGEAKIMDDAGNAAISEAQKWLETEGGKIWLKETVKVVAKEIKEDIKSGIISKVKYLEKEAIAKSKARLFVEKELDARKAAQEKYRAAQPPIVEGRLPPDSDDDDDEDVPEPEEKEKKKKGFFSRGISRGKNKDKEKAADKKGGKEEKKKKKGKRR